MTSTLCTCTWLLLLCCILVTLSTGELDFYRDEIPKSSENIALRQLIRYFEGQSPHFSLAGEPHKKHHPSSDRQRARDLLEFLSERGSLSELVRKPKVWIPQGRYNDQPINELPRKHYVPYLALEPLFDAPPEYPDLKSPYVPYETEGDETNFPDDGYEYRDQPLLNRSPYEEKIFKGMREEPLLELDGSYGGLVEEEVKNDREMQKPQEASPDFTYKFDESGLRERHPFAVKPNDLRYYQDAPFFSSNEEESDESVRNHSDSEREKTMEEKTHAMHNDIPKRIESKFQDTSVIMVPEIERRTEYNPLFVPINQDLNTDIYFIAIVAGCSAAAMFVLVLIALTWCRLKRGAKAAADIEYPAYGVTGPNKEISPSGDQRLAQSAQMYHFQHQKQQIIAMENRVSATRDPGSVSEADSDEENEEGDYTVYECPGLASTGEMEVKNPLFHDDPTPATPAQIITKEEDHNK